MLDTYSANKLIDEMNHLINGAKPLFEEFIKNKNISLDERWDVFLKAPDILKNHYLYVQDFLDLDISWYDDFYLDRYQTMTIERMIQMLEEDALLAGSLDRRPLAQRTCGIKCIMTSRLDKLKEEILARNIGSFVNDW